MERPSQSIVFAGGGTGGHLFPALSVADELKHRQPSASISFIGGTRGLEQRLVPRAGYPLRSLRMSGIKGRGAAGRALAGAMAAWATLRCIAWMIGSRPDLVIGVGGYASGPAMLAALLLRIDTMVLEQNHYPGATNRWLAPRVDVACVPSEAARERLDGVGIVTGNPVRAEFLEIGDPPGDRELSVLVFGGSRGARTINRAMVEALGALARLERPPRIVHQTGDDDHDAVSEAYRAHRGLPWEVHPFLDDMPQRLAAADLVICRAGASTLSEITAAGRPALLVPYPHAADDHQRHNAETLARAGAAVVLLDAELDGERLAGELAQLADQPERRAAMSRAARTLALPDATSRIAGIAEMLLAGETDVS